MANKNLSSAKVNKNDEFYTTLEVVNNELIHYRDKFENKVIYMNTDNPEFSQFWKFFVLNFEFCKIKKIVSTYYKKGEKVFKTERYWKDGAVVEEKTELKGDGDFRSQECKDILQECDIVVTNPPFSLFRDFVSLLEEYDKKYLIIGNMNAITYKEIFPLIKGGKLWLGINNGSKSYAVPDSYTHLKTFIEDGVVMTKLGNTCWFTNLDYRKRHEDFIPLVYNYFEEKDNYPYYDNYDAINVDDVYKIPDHYWGNIGVPITFLCKMNPEQFFLCDSNDLCLPHMSKKNTMLIKDKDSSINNQPKYVRVVIKRKNLQKINTVEELKEKLKYLYDRPGGFYTLSFKTDKESLVVITMTDDTRTTTLSIRIMSEEGETYEERLKEVLFHDFKVRECDLPFEEFYKKGESIFNNLF